MVFKTVPIHCKSVSCSCARNPPAAHSSLRAFRCYPGRGAGDLIPHVCALTHPEICLLLVDLKHHSIINGQPYFWLCSFSPAKRGFVPRLAALNLMKRTKKFPRGRQRRSKKIRMLHQGKASLQRGFSV